MKLTLAILVIAFLELSKNREYLVPSLVYIEYAHAYGSTIIYIL